MTPQTLSAMMVLVLMARYVPVSIVANSTKHNAVRIVHIVVPMVTLAVELLHEYGAAKPSNDVLKLTFTVLQGPVRFHPLFCLLS